MIGKVNAIVTYLAWILLLANIISFALMFADIIFEPTFYVFMMGSFFFFALFHLVAAFWVRCPNCNKCLTIQGFDEVHPDSIHKSWSSVVFHWFSGEVGCIHCGVKVKTDDI